MGSVSAELWDMWDAILAAMNGFKMCAEIVLRE
jgi:hypothetical protein